jgi:hypothetical protein
MMLTISYALRKVTAAVLTFASLLAGNATSGQSAAAVGVQPPTSRPFLLEEATIADIHAAIMRRELTAVDLVQAYLARIKAYDGVCVDQPRESLGR